VRERAVPAAGAWCGGGGGQRVVGMMQSTRTKRSRRVARARGSGARRGHSGRAP
jgi:hypothetical protein